MIEKSITREHPFPARIVQREILGKPGTKKSTYHLVIDIAGSGLHYEPGDSVGIYPLNDPVLVKKTIASMGAGGDEVVRGMSLRDYLTKHANISDVSRKLLQTIAAKQTNASKKEHYDRLFSETGKEALKEYVEARELWDVLSENREVVFTPEELCANLMPLLPRFYSIASSQRVVGDQIHLMIALLHYESLGHARRGVCTHFLCEWAEMNTPSIPVFIQPHKGFTPPPKEETPMIMVGPGTGVAPFRAFLQERVARKASGGHWLFFGEWHQEFDFYYEEFWKELVALGLLRMETAFSRDQEEKVYVQHLLEENGPEIFSWLERGAIFYVCGDASRMAKDVEASLLKIIEQEGKRTPEEAKSYLKAMRSEKRYLRDIY